MTTKCDIWDQQEFALYLAIEMDIAIGFEKGIERGIRQERFCNQKIAVRRQRWRWKDTVEKMEVEGCC